MHSSRNFLIESLPTLFENKELEASCLEEFHSLFLEDGSKHKHLFNSIGELLSGKISRKEVVTEEFMLCDEATLKKFREKFLSVMSSINRYQINSDNTLQKQADIDEVKELINAIVPFVCDQMLQSNGHMKPRLLDLFKCQQPVNQQMVCKLIFAYLHFIFQNIISSEDVVKNIAPLMNQYNAIAKVFNDQKYILIAEHLRKTNRFFDEAALATFSPSKNGFIEYMRKPSTLATLSIVGASLAAAVVAVKTVTFFNCGPGSQSPRP